MQWCTFAQGILSLQALYIFVVVLLAVPVSGKKKAEPLLTASKCLSESGDVQVQCTQPNQKIKVRSVSYAHATDCSSPKNIDDCVQASVWLAQKTQDQCDGLLSCKVPVLSISAFNSQQDQLGPDSETVFAVLDTCNVDGYLQQTVSMNLFQVKFECEASNNGLDLLTSRLRNGLSKRSSDRSMFTGRETGDSDNVDEEFTFCKEMSSEVIDAAIATENWPVKTVTNPTCDCTFASADPDAYHLSGYTHCNGTVMFVTEEFYNDGTSDTLDYECTDTFDAEFMMLATKKPYKIRLSVDVSRSDEESAYEISWFNVKANSKARKLNTLIKVDCKAGKLYLKASVQLILKIVIPIGTILLIALIVIYCVCSKRRRRAKDWRASHVRLSRTRQAGMELSSTASRSSSIDSFSHKKHQRVDPEGNVDDIGELAAMIHKQNEERKRQEAEKRQAYKLQQAQRSVPQIAPVAATTARPSTPPPVKPSIQTNRRAQSIGNLRSNRSYIYAENMDTTPYSKPLAYSKSASQSRASVRSLKRRAPQPTGPPQAPLPTDTSSRPTRLSSASSIPSVHRIRARNASQPALYAHVPLSQPPSYPPPGREPPQYVSPYAASTSVLSSPRYSEADANNSDEDMPILRPGSRPKPGHAHKPAVAPKPVLPPKQNPRYPPPKPNRSITPGEMRELQKELDTSD